MIEPSELMIGNYLQDKKGRLCIVEKIEKDSFYVSPIEGAISTLPYTPIPLSPELLERCAGFECEYKSNYHTVYYSESLKLSYYFWHIVDKNNQYLQIGALQVPCEHLHALQNLIITLTGKELKIK